MMEYLEKLPFFLFAAVAWSVVVFGTIAIFQRLKENWTVSRKERWLKRLLNGQPLEEVLSAAPCKYGHFQGEDGYRIWDERLENGFVHFASTPLDAHLWIVEAYLSEQELVRQSFTCE